MSDQGRILVIDSQPETRSLIRQALTAAGFEVSAVETSREGLLRTGDTLFEAVLLDLRARTPDDGRLLEELRSNGEPALLVFTDSNEPEHALEVIRLGAVSCPVKPTSPDVIVEWTRYALLHRDLEQANAALRKIGARSGQDEIVARSDRMRAVVEQIARVADSKASILLGGETGSGKGLVAKALHRSSSRRDQPFVHVNCAALQADLLESELFGHERGAFTGAVASKLGLFEVAHGGTLLLDEVGELQPRASGQAAAGPRLGRASPGRRHTASIRRRSSDLGDEAESPLRGQGWRVQGRPVLPPERRENGGAPAATAQRGHSRAHPAVFDAILPPWSAPEESLSPRAPDAGRVPLARERTGAEQRLGRGLPRE